MHRIEKPPLQTFLRRHRAAREEQLGCPALTNHAWQQRTCAHVGTSQTDTRKQKSSFGLWRAKPHVRSQGHHRASACANAVNRGNDGLRAQAHLFDQVACHAGELQHLGHAHFCQWANNFVHIAARAKIAAFASQHHSLDIGGVVQRYKQIAQLMVRIKGQRIFALRAVQGQGCHACFKRIREVLGFVAGHRIKLRTHWVARGDEVFHKVSNIFA